MSDTGSETVLIVNPESGSGDHVATVHDRADRFGYAVRETERESHAVDLAREAVASGATEVVAVGGDGTLNEVVRGVVAAEATEDVTVGVVPAGTGNDFAEHLGIASIEDGFEVVRRGERRRLDLGIAGARPFVNSCVAGLTAKASGETSPALKSRLGVLAYVVTTLRELEGFQGLALTAAVDAEGGDPEEVWSGSAAVVLVGNARRFGRSASEQANVEDGLLDVTIVEEAPSATLVEERVRERLLGEEGDHVTRILASSLELDVAEDGPASFSLDGEIARFDSVTCTTRRRALRMPVGESYDPTPDAG